MLLSLTRLRLRRWRDLPAFLRLSRACAEQAAADPGCAGVALYPGPGPVFWTATLWAEEGALRAYFGSGAHAIALPRLRELCSEAAVARADLDRLPAAAELPALFTGRARFSGVNEPTTLQQAKVIPDRAPWLRNVVKLPASRV